MYLQVPKVNSYSLTDFHDFDECLFRFFVRHHLDKKYEIAKGSPQLSLGVLLDKTIKNIHKYKAYNKPIDRLIKAIRFTAQQIKEAEEKNPKKPNFDTQTVKFLNEEVITAAEGILGSYLSGIKGKIKPSLGEVGFCKRYIKIDDRYFLLWGGPDTLEEGKDGIPEVVDYKSRQDIARGKERMDMDLMPKLYTLLVAEWLLKKGYKKARFCVRFWQDPKDDSFTEEFDLERLQDKEEVFKEKIRKIQKTVEAEFCVTQFCDACNYQTKDSFTEELKNKFGVSIIMK